jgi:hypothetical protein
MPAAVQSMCGGWCILQVISKVVGNVILSRAKNLSATFAKLRVTPVRTCLKNDF